jgi:hypothetical protein
VLPIRVATLPLFLLSLFMSLLLNSFRFLLKPGGGGSIGAVRRRTLDLPVQTGATRRLLDVLLLAQAFKNARYTTRSIASTRVQFGPLAAFAGGAATSDPSLQQLLLSWSAEFFDIHSSLRYTVVGPRATYVSLAGAEMA